MALHSQPLVLEVTEGRPSYSPGTLTTCTACIRTVFNPGVQQATAQAAWQGVLGPAVQEAVWDSSRWEGGRVCPLCQALVRD